MWFVRIQADLKEPLARFRHKLDLQAATDQESIWVRCLDREPVELRAIPHAEFFQLVDENLLRPVRNSLATLRVPQLQWKALFELLPIELPSASFCSANYAAVPISLIASEMERDCNVLIADRGMFASYAITLPSVRLSRWKMAIDQNRVVVWGSPSPSIPRQRYYESFGVAIPAGFETSPVKDLEVVRELFAIEQENLVVLHNEVPVHAEIISGDAFVTVERSILKEIAQPRET